MTPTLQRMARGWWIAPVVLRGDCPQTKIAMHRLLLAALLICVAALRPLGSTTLVRYDLEELARHAESVFVGICKSTRTEIVNGAIYTCLHFAVGEVLKGETDDEIVVYLRGGRYGGVRSHIPGMPSFKPGEEVVLFLTEADALGHAWPVGLAQGKFRIERGGAAKQARVFQDLGRATYYSKAGAVAKKASAPADLDGLPLKEFLARVRHYTGAAQDSGPDAPR